MPKYVIERELPGAGDLSPAQLQLLSQKSCGILRGMGPEIEWMHSSPTTSCTASMSRPTPSSSANMPATAAFR